LPHGKSKLFPGLKRVKSVEDMLAVAAKAEQAVENLFRLPSSLQELANLLTNMFPLWIATSVLLGLYCPSTVM